MSVLKCLQRFLAYIFKTSGSRSCPDCYCLDFRISFIMKWPILCINFRMRISYRRLKQKINGKPIIRNGNPGTTGISHPTIPMIIKIVPTIGKIIRCHSGLHRRRCARYVSLLFCLSDKSQTPLSYRVCLVKMYLENHIKNCPDNYC